MFGYFPDPFQIDPHKTDPFKNYLCEIHSDETDPSSTESLEIGSYENDSLKLILNE